MNFPTTILSPSIFFSFSLFFFFIREWQPFKFRHKAPRLPPSPLYPAITTTVPLSTPVLKVHCDRNEGGKKIGQDRVSFPILFSLSFFLFFFLSIEASCLRERLAWSMKLRTLDLAAIIILTFHLSTDDRDNMLINLILLFYGVFLTNRIFLLPYSTHKPDIFFG